MGVSALRHVNDSITCKMHIQLLFENPINAKIQKNPINAKIQKKKNKKSERLFNHKGPEAPLPVL